ncbi:MAG: hypothetical protein ACHQQP_06855, partial [Gemmatimonadales bacterium]
MNITVIAVHVLAVVANITPIYTRVYTVLSDVSAIGTSSSKVALRAIHPHVANVPADGAIVVAHVPSVMRDFSAVLANVAAVPA